MPATTAVPDAQGVIGTDSCSVFIHMYYVYYCCSFGFSQWG